MLAKLAIDNVAVIEHSDIEFDMGFNVLTGETGAGKSIVIDSINLVLGQRSNRELIRTGANKASVNAVFTELSEKTVNRLDEFGLSPDEDGNLFLEREITADGRGTARINGKAVPVSVLRELGATLIHIHGQHDNQALMASEHHIDLLDAFAEVEVLKKGFDEEFSVYRKLKSHLNSLITDEEVRERRIELLKFQINEIDSYELVIGEEEELIAKRKRVQNAEKIATALGGAYEILTGNDEYSGVSDLAKSAANQLVSVSSVMQAAGTKSEELYDIAYRIDDIASEIRDLLESEALDIDINEVESRLDIIYRLKSKYGNSIEEILKYRDKAEDELNEFVSSDELKAELNNKCEAAYSSAYELATEISKKRKAAAEALESRVADELEFLNMQGSVFKTDITVNEELNENGLDDVVFLLSANVGEEPKPLSKIASGGELSRIMLAIKNALAEKEDITMIFDEIDTGVSGRAAQKIGIKLKQISKGKQILCVTHLAQIAVYGDVHMLIEKESRDERTYTKINKLNKSERIDELARIMGGEVITEITCKSAEELLDFANKTL